MKNNKIKNRLLVIGCLATMIVGISSANALTVNSDGTYTTKSGTTLTSKQYEMLKDDKWPEADIEKVSKEIVEGIESGYYDFGTTTKHIITTTRYDALGRVIDVKQLEVPKEEAEKVLNNDNYHILSDLKLHDIKKERVASTFGGGSGTWDYETTYKQLTIHYENINYVYNIDLNNEWKKTPQVKGYDVIAVRFTNNVDPSNYTVYGRQDANNGNTAIYNNDNSNYVKFKNGVGLTQNLYDASTNFHNYLQVQSNYYLGSVVYGTYQHCRNINLSMAQSKSYTIGAGGLGDVILFKNNIGQYYDDMLGVQQAVTYYA